MIHKVVFFSCGIAEDLEFYSLFCLLFLTLEWQTPFKVLL